MRPPAANPATVATAKIRTKRARTSLTRAVSPDGRRLGRGGGGLPAGALRGEAPASTSALDRHGLGGTRVPGLDAMAAAGVANGDPRPLPLHSAPGGGSRRAMCVARALIVHPAFPLALAPTPPPPARWADVPLDVVRLVAARLTTARDLCSFAQVARETRCESGGGRGEWGGARARARRRPGAPARPPTHPRRSSYTALLPRTTPCGAPCSPARSPPLRRRSRPARRPPAAATAVATPATAIATSIGVSEEGGRGGGRVGGGGDARAVDARRPDPRPPPPCSFHHVLLYTCLCGKRPGGRAGRGPALTRLGDGAVFVSLPAAA
jgi:hypothetical protein